MPESDLTDTRGALLELERLILRDEHLMGSLLEAWDHSEGDTVAELIDTKIRRRMGRV